MGDWTMGIIAENQATGNSRRSFDTLAEYAAYQGAPESAFVAAGWQMRPVMHRDRPALEYRTATGPRWRFIDGDKPKYDSPNGYERCWYGLQRAVAIAQQTGQPLVIANGEAGVVVGQYHGIAATAITGGETGTIPPALLETLKAAYPSGRIIVAQDCDETGRKAGPKLARALCDAGYVADAADLQLPDKGDLADFCKLHGSKGDKILSALPTLALPEPTPIFTARESREPAHAGTLVWEDERRLWWVEVVLPAVERAATHRRRKHFRCINPAHPDQHPSARISTTKDKDGLYVCTCGAHSREAVGEWLGLDFMAWWMDNRASLYQRPTRPDGNTPTDDDLAALQDDTARFNALPSVGQGRIIHNTAADYPHSHNANPVPISAQGSAFLNSESHKLSEAPETVTVTHWSAWGTVEDQHVFTAQSTNVQNMGALFLTLACTGIHAEPFDLYQVEQAGKAHFGDKALSYPALYRLTKQPLFDKLFENFSDFYTIEEQIQCKNSENTPRHKPRLQYRLRERATVEAELWTAAADRAWKLAQQRGAEKLPPTLKPRFAQSLAGVTADNAATVAEQYNAALERLAALDPDIELGLSTFKSRYNELITYLERAAEAAEASPASEIPRVKDFADLLHKDADLHVILGSYCHRYDQKRVPDRPRTTTLDAFVAGVSVPLVSRISGVKDDGKVIKPGIREIAETRYKADTRVTVELTPNPDTLFDQIKQASRHERGYALYMQVAGAGTAAIRKENIDRICSAAQRAEVDVELILSVSQPMERYNPAEEPARKRIPRRRRARPPQEQKPRIKSTPKDVPALVQDAFTRLMKGYKWTFDGECWSDPAGRQYADDAPVLLAALTKQMSEDTTMLTMHYQAEKYDEPEESLPVEVQQTFAEPKPAPVFPNWEDRQPDAWVMNFNVLREPGLFDRRVTA